MKKRYFVTSLKVLLAVGTLVTGFSCAAQSFGQADVRDRSTSADTQSNASAQNQNTWGQGQSGMTQGQSAMAQSQGQGMSPGMQTLPTITNPRNAAMQQPAQILTRPAKSVPAVKGVFENYAAVVTGRNLPIFGQGVFADVPTTFAPVEGAPVNPDYTVGSGDELQIRGWGMVDMDVTVKVDRSGAVNIPRIGSVNVSGVKYRDLQNYLTQAVAKVYKNFQLTVSIAQSRAVQIYVTGHAVRPGTYTLSAMSTLLNALFVSGGPDATGSMRNIQVKRGTQVLTSFDLYDMLVTGDKSKDVPLRDGDLIYIPEVGELVALTGNVKQPSIFELKGRTSLAEVVRWAGGFDSSTEGKQILVERNVNNSYQPVAEFLADDRAVKDHLGPIILHPADVVRVFAPGAVPVQAQVGREYVKVTGEIKHTGMVEIRKGETLRELIVRIGGPTENGYLFATRFVRESVRRAQQIKLNEAADRFEHDLDNSASERLARTIDQTSIAAITADIERQHLAAQRMREVKAEGRIVLELADSNSEVKNLPDLPLQDGDSIHIPRRPGTVEVVGAVYQPNSILHRPRRTVNDYLELAGGFNSAADKSEIYLVRADGTAKSNHASGWSFSGVGGETMNPGDTIIVPEKLDRTSWLQSFKEWTTVFYQFGLGAAGLKVLKD